MLYGLCGKTIFAKIFSGGFRLKITESLDHSR